jgi:16S rRNA (guanine527-N7)-methyltransferase
VLQTWLQKDTGPGDERIIASGLICLKGGDLAAEIHESKSRPMTWEIGSFFSEPFFHEKYILQIS